jgi:hypothetical protein
MAIYTATLSAQNTNVYVCDIERSRAFDSWFANCCVSGTFGGGTVTFLLSFDNGVTLLPMHMDGTNVNAAHTTAACLNLRLGGEITKPSSPVKLYASIGAATTPSVAITVFDNR